MEVLTTDEGRIAVALARSAIAGRLGVTVPPAPGNGPIFREKRGVFVTLEKGGDLRGCIGFPLPVLPLGEAIRDAAISAAFDDPRFPPVREAEYPLLSVDVTVLSVPVPLPGEPAARADLVEVGRHGLIVRCRGRSGLLLPQVATEFGWDAREFLSHTCQKAGLPFQCWSTSGCEVLVFEGQVFSG